MDMSSNHPLSEKGSRIFEPHEGPGRPKCQIQCEMLEELIGTQWIYLWKNGLSTPPSLPPLMDDTRNPVITAQ